MNSTRDHYRIVRLTFNFHLLVNCLFRYIINIILRSQTKRNHLESRGTSPNLVLMRLTLRRIVKLNGAPQHQGHQRQVTFYDSFNNSLLVVPT